MASGAIPDPFQRVFNAGRGTDPRNSLEAILREVPEGKVNPVATAVGDPVGMSRRIKEVARFFGADAVGIARLDPAYVFSHRARSLPAEGKQAGDPVDLPHQYAICLGVASDYRRYLGANRYIADAECIWGPTKALFVAFHVASYIREMGYPARRHAFGVSEVNPVALAVMAGLGELGRHGLLINEKHGCRLHLAVVTTDLPLAIDQPIDIAVDDFCRYCKKCARSCPSRSVTFSDVKDVYNGVEKWRINVESCYKHRIASQHNCLWCANACCYNKADTWYHTLTIEVLKRTPIPLRPWLIRPLLWVDDRIWGARPRPRTQWLDYPSEQEGGPCALAGCVAVHRPLHEKRLQRPGRWVQSRFFPSDDGRSVSPAP